MSSPPSWPAAASMAAPASRVRSASSADTVRPWLLRSATAAALRPVSRATIMTSAPASARAVANALPSPWFPPVTTALRPSSAKRSSTRTLPPEGRLLLRGDGVPRDRGPADREHDRRLLGVPAMVHAVEHDVVPLLGEQHAAARELDPEPAADQEDRRRAPLAGDPLRAPVVAGMDGPLDLDVVAVAGVAGRLEVPEQPAAAGRGVSGRVPHVDPLCHAP